MTTAFQRSKTVSAAASRVPIFYYHSIGHGALCVPPRAFERQMLWLKRHGFQCLTASEWATATEFSGPVVILTFDDGFSGVFRHAMPILKSLGFHATVFVPAEYPGRTLWGDPATRKWSPNHFEGAVSYPIMTWDELKVLAGLGWEVGGHGVTHQNLTDLTVQSARDEIAGSREVLQRRLGIQIRTFCYPRGRCTEGLQHAVKAEGYLCAFGTEPGFANIVLNRFALPRFAAGPYVSDFAMTARCRTEGTAWRLIRRSSVLLERSVSAIRSRPAKMARLP